MNEHINRKIEETLMASDGIMPAEPKPFLLTRVNAAIRKKVADDNSAWSKIAVVLRKPMVAFSVLVVLLFANALVITNSEATGKKRSIASGNATKYDFAVNVSGIYDIENQEP